MNMKPVPGQGWAIAAMGWTSLYVASKAHYALTDKLGVTGGPEVDPASYNDYGPGGVAAAQWGNVGMGLLGIVLLALPLLPRMRWLPRWLMASLLVAFALMMLVGGIGMLVRALTSDVGGAVFGGYSLVWSALIVLAARRTLWPAAGRHTEAVGVGREGVTT